MTTALTTSDVARILAARGYPVHEGPLREIVGGSPDSRRVSPGELFAAFRGEQRDGNDFVPAAIAAGAAAVVCERAPAELGEATVAVVPDARAALAELAGDWRRLCRPRVVGITGTVGKTTAKEATAATLATRFPTHRSPGNLNSREGLPLALLSLRRDHEISVLEMAMDSPGEILELVAIAKPEVGVVLNIGLTHVSKLGTIEAIAREKLSLVRALPADGTAVLNAEDPRVAAAAPALPCRVLRFGPTKTGAELVYDEVTELGLEGTRFRASFQCGPWVPVRSPLVGRHTLPAALTALAAGIALGLGLEEVAGALSAAQIEGRMKVIRVPAGYTVIDDRYNSSPASLAGALRTLDSAVAHAAGPGRRLALLGAMAELGEYEEPEHRAAGSIAAATCDILFAVGEPARALVDAARQAGLADARWYESKDEAAEAVRRALRPGDIVLVKASRSQEFESVIPALTGDAP